MNIEIENFLASFPFAETTKKKYRRVLDDLIRLDALDALSPAALLAFIQKPNWGNSQQSIALYACHKYLRFTFGSLHPALSARLKRIIPKPRRSLTKEKALQLLASFNPYTPIGARGLALVAFGLDTGFRSSELCSITLDNINFETNTVIALCKGGQFKYATFSPETSVLLQAWLAVRRARTGVNNLFVSIVAGKTLTRDGLGCIFKHWSKTLGFKISPHDLRSSFATLATFYGAPSRTVQIGGRWSSIEMVEHYTGNLQLEAIRQYLPMHHIMKD